MNVKKLICALFAVVIVIGFSATVVFALFGNFEKAEVPSTTGTTVPSEPQLGKPPRPEDPGTVPPAEVDISGIANGIVWDMENLPKDLVEADWMYAINNVYEAFKDGNVTYKRAEGRGRNNSAALEITQVGQYSWSDVFLFPTNVEETGTWYWQDEDVLWIWYDTTEFYTDVYLEIFVNDKSMVIGAPCYDIKEGSDVVTERTVPPGWHGAEYGRMLLKAKTKGWIGVPLSAYEATMGSIQTLRFHVAYTVNGLTGVHVYLDDLCILPQGKYPTELD